MMGSVESIMAEKNQCESEIKNLADELQAAKVLLTDLKLQKEEIIQKMDKALEESEVNEKRKLANLNDEHKASVELMLKEHSSVVEELKRGKSEAIELVKRQHSKQIADLLAAKDDEHRQALEEREKQLDNLLSQKEEQIKAAYSEKVTFRCSTYVDVICHIKAT